MRPRRGGCGGGAPRKMELPLLVPSTLVAERAAGRVRATLLAVLLGLGAALGARAHLALIHDFGSEKSIQLLPHPVGQALEIYYIIISTIF